MAEEDIEQENNISSDDVSEIDRTESKKDDENVDEQSVVLEISEESKEKTKEANSKSDKQADKGIDLLKAEMAKNTNQLKRLQAEFDNYRKRMVKERADWKRLALTDFLLEILEVIDNFDRALQSVNDEQKEMPLYPNSTIKRSKGKLTPLLLVILLYQKLKKMSKVKKNSLKLQKINVMLQ